jgi:hypothetical protein
MPAALPGGGNMWGGGMAESICGGRPGGSAISGGWGILRPGGRPGGGKISENDVGGR